MFTSCPVGAALIALIAPSPRWSPRNIYKAGDETNVSDTSELNEPVTGRIRKLLRFFWRWLTIS